MRLKSINKASSNTGSGSLNSSRIPNHLQHHQSGSLVDPTSTTGRNNTNGNLSFSILNQDLSNIDENSFDLDMDSGEDEIDVGTHADSMLINYNNIHHSSDSFSSFPHNNNSNNLPSSSSLQGNNIQNDQNQQQHQFGINTLNNQFNSHEVLDNFAVPQHTATMSEADRKRAHHNALERKRRDHIKDSFHTLRDAIPNIKGEKVSTSRAQILKAATDYIKTMKNRNTVYQNDIDLIKKQNMDIENQIRQLEKSKLQNVSQTGLNSSILIKSEQQALNLPNNHIQLTDTSDDNNDFKYDLTPDMHVSTTTSASNNMLHASTSNVIKANNVLILTKPSVNGTAGTTKKFKTIMNPQKTNLMANSNTNFL